MSSRSVSMNVNSGAATLGLPDGYSEYQLRDAGQGHVRIEIPNKDFYLEYTNIHGKKRVQIIRDGRIIGTIMCRRFRLVSKDGHVSMPLE